MLLVNHGHSIALKPATGGALVMVFLIASYVVHCCLSSAWLMHKPSDANSDATNCAWFVHKLLNAYHSDVCHQVIEAVLVSLFGCLFVCLFVGCRASLACKFACLFEWLGCLCVVSVFAWLFFRFKRSRNKTQHTRLPDFSLPVFASNINAQPVLNNTGVKTQVLYK